MLKWLLYLIPRLFIFLVWNKTTWLIFFLLLISVFIWVAYKRIYFRKLKRFKVGGKKCALVTGGNGGLGYAFAKLLVEDEFNVVIIGRNPSKMEFAVSELKKISKHEDQKILGLNYDLSDSDSPSSIFKDLGIEGLEEVDILINNAGVGFMGRFEEHEIPYSKMVSLNSGAMADLIRLALPGMIRREWGMIMNVSSLGGFQPGPFNNTYGATKVFVRFLTYGLNSELSNYPNISCTCFAPGGINTNIFDDIKGFDIKGMTKKYGFKLQTPEDSAIDGYRSMIFREEERIPQLKDFLFSKFFECVLPFWATTTLMKYMMEPYVRSVKDL